MTRNHTTATKNKMRVSALKRIEERPWTLPAGWNKGQKTGIKPPNYKGEHATYTAHHHWVRYYLGRPSECENCGVTEGRFEWANLSGEYLRELSDWARLCVRCHRLIDDVVRKSWETRKTNVL